MANLISNLLSRMLWSMVSKAAERSKSIKHATSQFSKALIRSVLTLRRASFCAVVSTIGRLMDLHEIVPLNVIYKLNSHYMLNQFTYIAEV